MPAKDIKNTPQRKMMELRNYKVVKSNDLIQKSRFNLSLQEQKIILYLISKVKPEDTEEKIIRLIDSITEELILPKRERLVV